MASMLLAAALVAGRGPVVWAPQAGSQVLFMTCPIGECIYDGTRGPGKSDALLMDFAQEVGKGYGGAWRGILFRESYPQLSDIVSRSKKWFHQIFPDARFIQAGPEGYTWKFATGEELLFRYMEKPDDYWNYHGHEYPWIGWEELTNWPTLDCYHSMRACWRSSTLGIPRRMRATTNPFGIGHHEVKAYIVDPAPPGVPVRNEEGLYRVRIHGHWSENKKLLEADPDYVKNLASDRNENRRRAWLLGDWDIVAGGFFDDLWDRGKHVVRPFQIPRSWRVDRSFDWGSSKPFSVGWWAESDGTAVEVIDRVTRKVDMRQFPRGTLFRIHEWYGWTGHPNEGSKMLAVDVAKGVLQRDKDLSALGVQHVFAGPADPSIYAVENGNSIADDMAKVRVEWTRGDNTPGSRKTGWERMRKYFAASLEARPEEPGLYVFDSCTQFIRTVPVLPRHKLKTDDIDTNAEDHCLTSDTLVETESGPVRIADLVGTAGRVYATDGRLHKYFQCRLTRRNAEVVRVRFANDVVIHCTPDHLILTNDGRWVSALDLTDEKCYSIAIPQREEWLQSSASSALPSKNSRESATTVAVGTFSAKESGSIASYGNTSTAPSRTDTRSTTKTTTVQTTSHRILASCRTASTQLITDWIGRMSHVVGSVQHRRQPVNGTGVQKVESGTKNNTSDTAAPPSHVASRQSARTADGPSAVPSSRSSVATTVRAPHAAQLEQTSSSAVASSAEPRSRSTATGKRSPVVDHAAEGWRVVRIENAGRADVYCLDVPDLNAFAIEGGLIVHNCGDEARYRILAAPVGKWGSSKHGLFQ